ncbi:hypothetical protein ACFWZZ_05250 [[Kitasatospora] papulosa]|uniref:hypothetical protein n=1 Tax=[Kitasatospora] papulosa TaxID=1464011 RepID=UPI003691CCEA
MNRPRTTPPSDPVRWVATTWDDPDALALRRRMDAELRPRYAPSTLSVRVGGPGRRPRTRSP